MKNLILYSLVAASALLFTACEKKEEKPQTTEPAAQETPPGAQPTTGQPGTTTTVAATTVNLDNVPVEEDFEEEVEKEVTPANLDQKVESLEKEIQAE